MNKPWLTQYPLGVPAEIDLRRFASLVDMLSNGAKCSASTSVTGNWP